MLRQISNAIFSSRQTTRRRDSGSARLSWEPLEDRRLLATFAVTNLADTGSGSLRDAIVQANAASGADNIEIQVQGTVASLLGELEISEEVTIIGPGQDLFIVDAKETSRVINFSDPTGNLTMSGLTLTGGLTTGDNASTSDNTFSGAGLRFVSDGQLALTEVKVTGNNTTGISADGGGIYTEKGSVTLIDSTVSDNSTAGVTAFGGGISIDSGDVSLVNSTVTGNSTAGDTAQGGGIRTSSGNVTLDSSTISNNSTAGLDADGGGIRTNSGAITLTNSAANGNSTAGINADGGGITNIFGTVSLTNSTMFLNFTMAESAKGGGIAAGSGAVTLLNSTLNSNRTEGAIANGGGIFTASGAVTLFNSTVSGNETLGGSAYGGGIHTISGTVSLTGSTVSGNKTLGSVAEGGGIFTDSGNVNLTNSTLSGNLTQGNRAHGGGIHSNSGAVNLNSSTVSTNRTFGSDAEGGGISSDSGTVSLANSTVSGNRTEGLDGDGGGVRSDSGAVTLTNSTVTGNVAAEGQGGGVHVGNSGMLTIQNSVIASNSNDGTTPDVNRPSVFFFTVKNSLIGEYNGTGLTAAAVGSPDANGNFVGTTAAPIDPLLGPLSANGGPTQTHALLTGSPAIDAGDNTLAVDGNGIALTTDQRGETRIVDGDHSGTATVDMGAFEAEPAFLLGDVNQDGAVDFLDINPFIGVLSSGVFQAEADIDESGAVDFLDIDPFIVLLSSPPTAGTSAQFSAAPSESLESSRQVSDGISVQLSDAPSSPSLPPSDVASTQLSVGISESSLLTFTGISQMQNGDDSRNFRNERPVWNGESVARQLSHRKTDRLAERESFLDSGSRTSSLLDVFPEPVFATSSADLFDTHPELLDELLDFQLDDMFLVFAATRR